MKWLSTILIIVLFLSCAGYRKTKFTLDSVSLGDSIGHVIKQYGNPFKIDINTEEEENEISIKKIYYKEAVDVSSYTYMLTTILTFKDSVLIDIEQQEKYLPGGYDIKVE